MRIIDKEELNQYEGYSHVWYACYGSNINYDRFMKYINGDEKYSTSEGCEDKSEPLEERQYIFEHPIYFAGKSQIWGGGVAYLDYERPGRSYGKLYKVTMKQFEGILKQEQRAQLYNTILLVDTIDNLPVFSFTAKHRIDELLSEPSKEYLDVINKGIDDLYGNVEEIKKW
ncbi:MAG: hypothetical protein IKE91_03600 [Clostridia bacterium]|nr:hypothetical protein [Clostridia bacterium]